MLISAESMAREQMKRNWMTPPVLAQGAKSIGDVRALTEPDAASAGTMPQLFFARFGASMATLNERTLPYPFNHCYLVLLILEIELRENYTHSSTQAMRKNPNPSTLGQRFCHPRRRHSEKRLLARVTRRTEAKSIDCKWPVTDHIAICL